MIQSWVRYILVMKPTLVTIWMKTLFCKESLLYFEQFSIVRTSEAFLIKILCTGKQILYFKMWRGFLAYVGVCVFLDFF